MIIELDKLGRIVLKKGLREKYGKQFILVPKKDEIVLKPFSIDRKELAKKLEKYSIADLKKIAEDESIKEVSSVLK